MCNMALEHLATASCSYKHHLNFQKCHIYFFPHFNSLYFCLSASRNRRRRKGGGKRGHVQQRLTHVIKMTFQSVVGHVGEKVLKC